MIFLHSDKAYFLIIKWYDVHTVFKDVNTPSPFIEEFPEVKGEGASAAKPDHIYMDAMGFGMGCSCLQVYKNSFTLTPTFKIVNNIYQMFNLIEIFIKSANYSSQIMYLSGQFWYLTSEM